MNEHKIRAFDTAGVMQMELNDFTGLMVARDVNAPGILVMGLPDAHGLLDIIADKWQLEYWRKIEGQAWYREFVGMYRKYEWEYGEFPKDAITAPGLMDMLNWRIIGYHDGVTNRSKFTAIPAETICNTLVKYNTTVVGSLLDGRKRSATITGMSVEADGAEGNALDWECAFQPLLTTLQKICLKGGGDFDVVKTSTTTWQWRWYTGQLGTDRSLTVKFSLPLGNMASPSYLNDRLRAKSVAIVGGKGKGSGRLIEVVTGDEYAAANNIEVFVNASDEDTAAGLTAKGAAALIEQATKDEFNFSVLQIPNTLYGVHYFLGDLVTVVNPKTNVSATYKVNGVVITLGGDGKEVVDVSTKLNVASIPA